MKRSNGVRNKYLTNMRKQINSLIQRGEYSAATLAMQQQLGHPDLIQGHREFYTFEIERLARIRRDFNASLDDILQLIRVVYPDVTLEEIEQWEQNSALEYRLVDGQKVYFEEAARNLFRIDPTLRKLWEQQHPEQSPTSGSGVTLNLDKHISHVVNEAVNTGKQFVLPVKMRIKHGLEVQASTVPQGELIRCWLPFPRWIENRQQDIQIIQAQPKQYTLAPEDAPQRTIYFEKPAVSDQPTIFSVEYDLVSYGVFQHIHPETVIEPTITAELQEYLKEEPPHIVFSPAIQKLSTEIIGNEKNPYLKARLLLEWMNAHIPWASAREYSTIQHISDYAASNRHGDCGIQTLLFITLCRMNGIPARWQSGWELQPPDDSMHDWGMIYFEPYGWVPMDVTYGMRKSEDPRVQWFYLSGLDSYRIIFNDAIASDFIPPKQHCRSETLDNQRGEVEWSGGNIYFDKWRWQFQWELMERPEDLKKHVDK